MRVGIGCAPLLGAIGFLSGVIHGRNLSSLPPSQIGLLQLCEARHLKHGRIESHRCCTSCETIDLTDKCVSKVDGMLRAGLQRLAYRIAINDMVRLAAHELLDVLQHFELWILVPCPQGPSRLD